MFHRFFSSVAGHYSRPQSIKMLHEIQDITAQQLSRLKLDPKFAKIIANMDAQLQISEEKGAIIPTQTISNALDMQEESDKHSYYS